MGKSSTQKNFKQSTSSIAFCIYRIWLLQALTGILFTASCKLKAHKRHDSSKQKATGLAIDKQKNQVTQTKQKLRTLLQIYKANKDLHHEGIKQEAYFSPIELQQLENQKENDYQRFLPHYENLYSILESKTGTKNKQLNGWIECFTKDGVRLYQTYCRDFPTQRKYLKLLDEYTKGCKKFEAIFKQASLEEKTAVLAQMGLPPKRGKSPIDTKKQPRSSSLKEEKKPVLPQMNLLLKRGESPIATKKEPPSSSIKEEKKPVLPQKDLPPKRKGSPVGTKKQPPSSSIKEEEKAVLPQKNLPPKRRVSPVGTKKQPCSSSIKEDKKAVLPQKNLPPKRKGSPGGTKKQPRSSSIKEDKKAVLPQKNLLPKGGNHL